MPYDPTANPYVLNPLELPSNQTAAAMVPAWNISGAGDVGTPREWSHSPFSTPNWQNAIGAPNTPPWTPGVTVCLSTSVAWPDATTADRTACAQAALALEQARLQAREDSLNSDIALIQGTP
jgi:hypothetical protein